MTHEDENEIKRLRKEIDKCDDRIFDSLRTRCSLSYLIGLRKKNTNAPVVDNDRFNKMVDDKVNTYTTRFMDDIFIRKIYDVIHEHSCKIQQ
jgi:chorismate mutase